MPRAGGDRLRSSVEMRFGEFRDVTANIGECRLRQHPARGSGIDVVRPQQLARQIHPVPPSVFGEVAQYVGELQRALKEVLLSDRRSEIALLYAGARSIR